MPVDILCGVAGGGGGGGDMLTSSGGGFATVTSTRSVCGAGAMILTDSVIAGVGVGVGVGSAVCTGTTNSETFIGFLLIKLLYAKINAIASGSNTNIMLQIK